MKKSVLTACILLLAVCAAFLCPLQASATDSAILNPVFDCTTYHGSTDPLTLSTTCNGEAVAVLAVSAWSAVTLSDDDWTLAGAYQASAGNGVSGIYTFVYYKVVYDSVSVTITSSLSDNFYAFLLTHSGYRSITQTSTSTPKGRGTNYTNNYNISGVTVDPTLFFWAASSWDGGTSNTSLTSTDENAVSLCGSNTFLQCFYSENSGDPVTFAVPGSFHYVSCSVYKFADPAPASSDPSDEDDTSKGILSTVRSIFSKIKDMPGEIASSLSDKFTDLKNGITSKLNEVKQGILEIADKIGNKLQELFVPDELTAIEDIKSTVNDKFPFIAQLGDIFDGLFNFDDEATPPTFTFSWMGAEASVIDFAPFVSLRTPIHIIIALFVWIRFVMWLIDFVPKLLGGIGG